MKFIFFANSILLGVGLAMDAFSISVANGLAEPLMGRKKECLIAGTYGFFQFLMPMIGWLCVSTVAEYFKLFEKAIPWIALILLVCIGGKMLIEALRNRAGEAAPEHAKLKLHELFMQGIATSIDALSVGFTTAGYNLGAALVSSFIIAAVTFSICLSGLRIGKIFGMKLAGKAGILGGTILIIIGIEIFIRGIAGL